MLKKQTQKHWEKVGGNYSKFWQSKAKYEINKKELDFINKYLQQTKSQHILDIGIGSGRIVENYLKQPRVKKINGVDWAKSMVDFCREKFKKNKRVGRIMVCDISREKIPFNRKFDFISAIRVLKYNKNWPKIIGKIIRILDKDGAFIFTMPNKNAFLRFTAPETSIYSASKKEIEQAVLREGGEVLVAASFTKLPDVFYDVISSRYYIKAILLLEEFLRKVFGDIFLGREFFIAVCKRKK